MAVRQIFDVRASSDMETKLDLEVWVLDFHSHRSGFDEIGFFGASDGDN